MTPLTQHLRAALGSLPDEANALIQTAERYELGKGEAMLRAGQPWRQLWWVERGCLRLYYLDRQGQASNKNFHTDGAML